MLEVITFILKVLFSNVYKLFEHKLSEKLRYFTNYILPPIAQSLPMFATKATLDLMTFMGATNDQEFVTGSNISTV